MQLAAGQSVGGLLPFGTNGSTVPTVQGGGGQNNPYLEPITSKNFDISQEWYFGKLGSLTGMIFYKRLNNVINNVTSFVDTTATNNGVTYPEQLVTGLANVKQESALTGAEVAYQQQFSFLPGWLSGFGVTANYTYIHQHGFGFGSPNFCPATYAAATQCINQLTLPPIELSRDNANFTLFYATPKISARLGYNWRSAFLITGFEADYPFVPVMSGPQGQLDGSFIYTINKHLKVAVQAANILDSTFKSREIINTSGLQVPKGFFRDDIRLNIGLRATF
ncbi:MAG TPA: TonB-dependent receptor [Rhodanobacteraceae bacterium]